MHSQKRNRLALFVNSVSTDCAVFAERHPVFKGCIMARGHSAWSFVDIDIGFGQY